MLTIPLIKSVCLIFAHSLSPNCQPKSSPTFYFIEFYVTDYPTYKFVNGIVPFVPKFKELSENDPNLHTRFCSAFFLFGLFAPYLLNFFHCAYPCLVSYCTHPFRSAGQSNCEAARRRRRCLYLTVLDISRRVECRRVRQRRTHAVIQLISRPKYASFCLVGCMAQW